MDQFVTAKVHDKRDSGNAFTRDDGVAHIGGIYALVRLRTIPDSVTCEI